MRPANADTILFNTCSVRQHAEDKIYSALGRLKHAKQQNPSKIIGVLGCMAQKDQRLIFAARAVCRFDCRARSIAPSAPVAGRNCRRQRTAIGSQPRSQSGQSGRNRTKLRKLRSRPRSRRCGLRPIRRLSEFSLVAISSARTASCLKSVDRNKAATPNISWLKRKSWPTKGVWKLRCWGKPSTAIDTVDGDRTTRLSDLLYQLHDIAGIGTAKVCHEFSQRHDRRLVASGARFAQVFAVLARAGPKRLERNSEANEARVHGGRLSRNDVAHSRHYS